MVSLTQKATIDTAIIGSSAYHPRSLGSFEQPLQTVCSKNEHYFFYIITQQAAIPYVTFYV